MNAAEFHVRRKFAETSFGKIAWVERGAGPAALFIHGFPLNGFQWRDIADDLQDDRRCLMPDLMGQGHTEAAAGADRSFAGQARMLAAFLDSVKAESVDLIGNDTGAGISQMFATMYPARVRSWTLTNCEVHNLWPNPMLEQLLDAFESGMALDGLKMMLGDINIARQQFASAYENPASITEESVKTYLEPLLKADLQAKSGYGWRANREQLVSIAPKLRANKIPVQVVWAEADTAFDRDASINWLRENLGGLKKVTLVPRAKLFFPEEHPKLMSVMLREFWRSQS
jgi:pimeloyl-ACP methyl ester carboxylesterase